MGPTRQLILGTLASVLAGLAPSSLTPASPGPAAPLRLLLVHEGGSPPPPDFARGLREILERAAPGSSLEVLGAGALGSRAAGSPGVVLALGAETARMATGALPGPPLVHCLVPRVPPGATGLLLAHSPEVVLGWIRRALPRATRVGLLRSPASTAEELAEAQRAAEAAGLRLVTPLVPGPRELPQVLARLQDSVEVLWVTPDPELYTSATARRMLLFSYRHRIPLVGPSRAWARAGALLALDRDLEDMGRQAAELALAAAAAGSEGRPHPPRYPRRARLYLNERAREKMRLPPRPELLAEAVEVFR